MVISSYLRRSALFLLVVLFLYPYLFALSKISLAVTFDKNIIVVLFNTVVQAAIGSLAVLFFGFWAALGLLSVRDKKKVTIYKALCLFPSFLPTLFYVLATLEVIRPFPYGFSGILLVHTLTAVGLGALAFHSQIVSLWRPHAELAYLEGAGSFLFIKKMVVSSKHNVFLLFIFFFAYFFVSFATPLLVGHQFLTIETYIYEKLRQSGSFSLPAFASLLEMLILFFILWFYKPFSVTAKQNQLFQEKFPLLEKPKLKYMLWIPMFIYVLGSLLGIGSAITSSHYIHPEILSLLLSSVRLALCVGLLLILFFAIVTLNFKENKIQKFFFIYTALSTILFAMSFTLLPGDATLRSAFALSILFFPMLYRYQLKEKMDTLKDQYAVAELMGASSFLIFKKILFPQLKETIFFLAAIGTFWTVGEFAVSGFIYGQEKTLAIFIQDLASQYRLADATIYEMILLFVGLVLFWCVSELKYVFD